MEKKKHAQGWAKPLLELLEALDWNLEKTARQLAVSRLELESLIERAELKWKKNERAS